MTVQIKPTSYTKVWASTGNKVTPDDFKIGRGWEVEKPPHEVMNWVQNRQDQWIAHTNQRGVAQWDTSTEYKANISYVTGSTTGNVYRAAVDNVGVNPETDVSGKWEVAFTSPSFVSTTYLARASNLSDVSNTGVARTNLGVYGKAEVYTKIETYSKVEADNKYLTKLDNLADLSDKPTARTNLEVYSKADIDAMFPAGEVVMFAMGTMPAGFIPCDGRSLLRATYPRLFTAIGTLYGSVDPNSFNVPNFCGVFLRGWNAGNASAYDIGRLMGVLQGDENKAHKHVTYFAESSDFFPNGVAPGRHPGSRGGTDADNLHPYTSTEGGSESRPVNMPVYYGIRF